MGLRKQKSLGCGTNDQNLNVLLMRISECFLLPFFLIFITPSSSNHEFAKIKAHYFLYPIYPETYGIYQVIGTKELSSDLSKNMHLSYYWKRRIWKFHGNKKLRDFNVIEKSS